ncbi:MAG TPA: DUF2971 domain-containing protein [Thermoanaerobaculia bacterium]
MNICIVQGKGKKDRYVPLSPMVLELLREHWRRTWWHEWGTLNNMLHVLLYKYATASRSDILKTLRVRFTQPADLNDPFEILPRFDDTSGESDTSLDDAEREIAAFIQSTVAIETIEDAIAGIASQSAQFGESPEDRETLLRALVAILPSRQRLGFGLSLQRRFGETLGILSMSSVPDSLLMWAHYGDSHRGFAIEFDADHPFFHRGLTDGYVAVAKPVTYDSTRPAFVMPGRSGPDWVKVYLTRLLLTKSPDWSYEQEWRMLLPLNEQAEWPHVVSGRNHLFTIPAEAIQAVIIGNRCDVLSRRDIVASVKENAELRHVQLRYAHIHSDQFAVTISHSPWPTFPPPKL